MKLQDVIKRDGQGFDAVDTIQRAIADTLKTQLDTVAHQPASKRLMELLRQLEAQERCRS